MASFVGNMERDAMIAAFQEISINGFSTILFIHLGLSLGCGMVLTHNHRMGNLDKTKW